jgi:hypothetical protein
LVALPVGVLLFVVGCGSSNLVPARGHLTLDGAPVEGASLMFFPESESGQVAAAATDADGKFAAATRGTPGCVPGAYAISVTKKVTPPGAQESPQADRAEFEGKKKGAPNPYATKGQAVPRNVLPPQYADPATSKIRIEVPPGGKVDLELALTSTAQ